MSRRTKRRAGKHEPQTLHKWAAEYPEAKVTRRELYAILGHLFGKPKEEEAKEIEA